MQSTAWDVQILTDLVDAEHWLVCLIGLNCFFGNLRIMHKFGLANLD